jgi:hypothetical protein
MPSTPDSWIWRVGTAEYTFTGRITSRTAGLKARKRMMMTWGTDPRLFFNVEKGGRFIRQSCRDLPVCFWRDGSSAGSGFGSRMSDVGKGVCVPAGRHVERTESKGKELDPLPQGGYSGSRSGEANLGGGKVKEEKRWVGGIAHRAE